MQEALATQERQEKSSPSPSIHTLSWIPIDNNEVSLQVFVNSIFLIQLWQQKVIKSETQSLRNDQNPETKEIFIEEDFKSNPEVDLETAIKQKWESLLGKDSNIVVANLTKLKGT